MKKILSLALCIVFTFLLGVYPPMLNQQVSAAIAFTPSFSFNGSMSKEVLRSFASRAVTLDGLCGQGIKPDTIFEDDLRMILRTGAKFIGRAAHYDWSGNMTAAQIEEHYKIAKASATKAHKADPELILQAGIFEIIYRDTANNTAIPAWVFRAFGEPVEKRNFRYDDIAFPAGHRLSTGFWGNQSSAVPNIFSLETQMYFYYKICRYIDAGFESFHVGQIELMMDSKNLNSPVEWKKVLDKARAYAKSNARRGLVLFDAHTKYAIKVGNDLLLDLSAAPLRPMETVKENGAMKCIIVEHSPGKHQEARIGDSPGGQHPLGFHIDNNFMILELDNWGPAPSSIKPGTITDDIWTWGYDEITWFSLQPSWYRDQFYRESDSFCKSHKLDSEGKQVYFLQPSMRRVIVSEVTMTYKPGPALNVDFVSDYADKENAKFDYDAATHTITFTLKNGTDYRANRQSNGCPTGFGQEDVIRELFLGKSAPEDPDLLKVVLPAAYTKTSKSPAQSTTSNSKAPGASGSVSKAGTNTSANAGTSEKSAVSKSSSLSSVSSSSVETVDKYEYVANVPLILGISGGIVALGAGGFCLWFFKLRKKESTDKGNVA